MIQPIILAFAQPHLEGFSRIKQGVARERLSSTNRPPAPRSLKGRAVLISQGLALSIPLINTIIWMGMKKSGIAPIAQSTTPDASFVNRTQLPEATGAMTQRQKLERVLQEWVDDPKAKGDKKEAQMRILEAFTASATSLDLRNLALTCLPEQVFNFFPELRDLNLYNNQLTLFHIPANSLTSLTHLRLSSNRLTSLNIPARSLPSLTHLHCASNQLTSFNVPIGSLTSLIELNLYNNQIVSFTLSTGALTSLTHLRLYNNLLTLFHIPIGSLTSLIELNLYNNRLASFTLSRDALTSLTELNLANNRILRSIPRALGRIRTLSQLDVDNTQIPLDFARAILDEAQTLQQSGSKDFLPILLKLWASYAEQPNYTSTLLLKLNTEEKGHVVEWLHRLSRTQDFQTHQKELARIVLDILKDVSNQEFKKLFIAQIRDHNTACGDRVAMGLNEIYALWCITCPKKTAPLETKLKIIAGVAKTGVLRKILGSLIEGAHRWGVCFEESVEVYLYYESTLRDELGLITAIHSMLHSSIGKRDWIDKAYLKKQVNLHYLDEAVKTDFFDQLFQEDESATKALKELQEKFGARMATLDGQKDSLSEQTYVEQSDALMKERVSAQNKMKKEWLRSHLASSSP